MNLWHLRLAVRVLRQGGLVVHATEGVWGVAADPWNAAAVADLLALKRRSYIQGLIVIGAVEEMFAEEIAGLDSTIRSRIRESWPGPCTWILPTCRFPAWITGDRDTVGIRIPGHPQARALSCLFGGPLVSTSANVSGQPPAQRSLQARRFLRRYELQPSAALRQCYLLPGETLGNAGPSEIRTLDGGLVRPSPNEYEQPSAESRSQCLMVDR